MAGAAKKQLGSELDYIENTMIAIQGAMPEFLKAVLHVDVANKPVFSRLVFRYILRDLFNTYSCKSELSRSSPLLT